MKVYRIENSSGKGPYGRVSFIWQEFSDHPRPSPYEDGPALKKLYLSNEMHKNVCGFKSLKQLFSWFTPKELGKLKRLGFYVVEMELPRQEVTFGKYQVMFKKTDVIESHPWKWNSVKTKDIFQKYLSAKKMTIFKESSAYKVRTY